MLATTNKKREYARNSSVFLIKLSVRLSIINIVFNLYTYFQIYSLILILCCQRQVHSFCFTFFVILVPANSNSNDAIVVKAVRAPIPLWLLTRIRSRPSAFLSRMISVHHFLKYLKPFTPLHWHKECVEYNLYPKGCNEIAGKSQNEDIWRVTVQ